VGVCEEQTGLEPAGGITCTGEIASPTNFTSVARLSADRVAPGRPSLMGIHLGKLGSFPDWCCPTNKSLVGQDETLQKWDQ